MLTLDLKLASVSNDPHRIRLAAPVLNAPIMLADWRLVPDEGQRLIYRGGSLTPSGPGTDNSGFAQFVRFFAVPNLGQSRSTLFPGLLLFALSLISLRWASGAESKLNTRHVAGILVSAGAFLLASVFLYSFADQLSRLRVDVPRELAFLAPVQQPGSTLRLEALNLDEKTSIFQSVASVWPVVFALPLWLYAWVRRKPYL